MKRLVLIAAATLVAVAAAAPAGACAASTDPCLQDPLEATVEGLAWVDADADGVRDGDEHRELQARIFADYNHDGQRQPGEPLVVSARDGSYSLPVDTRRLEPGSDRADVRLLMPRLSRPELDSQCSGRAVGCAQLVDVRPGATRGAVDFPIVGEATVSGLVWDDKNDDGRRQSGEDGVKGLRVFLDDDNDGQFDPAESWTRSQADGRYRMSIPTRYQAAGGQLPALVLEPATGVACSAPQECAVHGLRTRSYEDTPADHGISRPAVIFIHGYGGSQIGCPGKQLWFNAPAGPDLMDLRLSADGRGLRVSEGGTVCSQNAMVGGLVKSVLGMDIYDGASKHFEAITWPGRHYDYVWDWRKSPEDAVDGLDALVERVRSETGVAKVQLVGHSMGGLVIRHYIQDDARARKVQRAVTVGAPYWGSPKTIFPLATGTEVPYASGMDLLLDNDGLKAASRTFPGHFALMPAFGYGPWLAVSGMNGGRPLDMDGVEEYLRRIGVNPSMYIRAASEHGRVLDHYEDHGVDFHVIIGGGLPTMAGVAIRYRTIDDEVQVSWLSGDETVPAFSAAHDAPRDNLHWVCGVSHVPLTTDPQTTKLIDAFLIRGESIRDERQGCDWSGRELSVYYPSTLTAMASAAPAQPRVIAGGRTLSLRDAERAGVVQVVTFGASTKIVARGGVDVRVELPAGGTATVRDLSQKGAGPERRFAITGTTAVALGGSGAVTKGGRPLKPAARDKRPPVTRAAVGRLGGGKVRLALRARDASKVAVTYVVVNGKRRVYKQPVVLSAKRLAKTTYGSVDIWGNAEAARKAPRL